MKMRQSIGVSGVIAGIAMLAIGCGSTRPDTSNSTGPVHTSSSRPKPAATESNPPGDIPDSQVYIRFRPSQGGASVKVPEGWARSATAGSTVFADKLNRIKIDISTATVAPTVRSVSKTDLPKLRSTVPKFRSGPVDSVRRAGQSVIRIRYQGDSAPDSVTGKVVRDAFERYVYYHNGRRLDLTLTGPVNADNVDPWRIVSDSVRWK